MPSVSSPVYFHVVDAVDGLLQIRGATALLHLAEAKAVQFALDLTPETPVEDAEALVGLLRQHVKQVRLWTAEEERMQQTTPVLTSMGS